MAKVERQVPNDSSGPQNTLFESALRAAGVQLVRLSPLHAYTVPGCYGPGSCRTRIALNCPRAGRWQLGKGNSGQLWLRRNRFAPCSCRLQGFASDIGLCTVWVLLRDAFVHHLGILCGRPALHKSDRS